MRAGAAAIGLATILIGCSVSSAGPMPPPTDPPPEDAASAGEAAAALSGRWVDAGRMPTRDAIDWPEPLAPRAVLLGDGRVLVVGDDRCQPEEEGAFYAATTATVWDPGTSSWSAVTSLETARARFAMVPLRDGRALVAGGMTGRSGSHSYIPYDSYSSAWVFSGETGRWARAGLLAQARTDPVYAVLRDGRVLVAGGYFAWSEAKRTGRTDTRGAGAGAELAAFTPNELADVTIPPPAAPLLLTAEVYDPRTNAWAATGSLNVGRFGGATATLSDGRVLVVGQRDLAYNQTYGIYADDRAATVTELYDPASGRFHPTGRLPSPRYGSALVALADGGAILIGGYAKARAGSWYEASAPPLRSVLRFDPKAGAWSETGSLRVARIDATAVRLRDGRILVAGGSTPYGPTASVEIYDPKSGAWAPGPAMPTPRAGGVAVLLKDGSALVVGGLAAHGHQLEFLDTCPRGATNAVRYVPRG